jgi:hypothetical protein
MLARLTIIAAVSFFFTMPVWAADSWECAFVVFDGPPGITSHATVKLDGGMFDWIIAPLDVSIPPTHIVPPAMRYRILENNNVGIVAVSSRARIDKTFGALITAETIALDKTNGRLHVGVVGTNGVHDNLSGTCRPK